MLFTNLDETTRAATVLLRRHDPLDAVVLQAGFDASVRGGTPPAALQHNLRTTGSLLREASDFRNRSDLNFRNH